MKVCIDTNAYSALLGGNEAVKQLLEHADVVIVPAAMVAECYDGFRYGTRFDKNVMLLDAFLSRPGVRFLPADENIAMCWGTISAQLRRKGRKIPANDIWIAATAFETGSCVLSYDHHFDEIDGIVRIAP